MPDSIREKILQHIETTTLESITVANGYAINIGQVERGKVNPLKLERFPAVLIFPGEDEPESLISDLTDRSWQILLFLWVLAQKDISKAMETFLAAVQKRMLVDHTRGGNAMDTAEGAVTPIRIEEVDLQGGWILNYSIRYRTKRGDPFTLG